MAATAQQATASTHAPDDPASAGPPAPNRQDQSDVQTLARDLQALKANYAQEVRRLRELDMQVQALQTRLTGKAGDTAIPAAPLSAESTTAVAAADSGHAGNQADASKAEQAAQSRSLQDALQQEHALFNRKLTIENGISYAWYDRKQLTLNGFLALDAIFLGNIALQDVKSNTFTYTAAARYGVSPRLTLNLEVPYLGRKTSYFQGGAGGAAAQIAEESTTGKGIGDITLSANYKLFSETDSRPDTVLTLGVVAPTGREPYGIKWVAPGGNTGNKADGRFSVPVEQPTGNGLWQTNLGVSAVKTMDPAIVFANLGVIHSFARSFPDIGTDPQTKSPGRVKLGDAYYFGAGVAFAFNDRTSLSLSFSDKVNGKASLQTRGASWTKIIGSDANAGTFNLGVTYALSQHTTLVTMLGIGLTPDAPNFMLTFKVPYIF
ncbi:transporter [Dyella tabacisoli]